MATIAAEARRAAAPEATPDERAKLGKSARSDVSRTTHGDWEPAPDRPDPVDVLEGQAETSVPELVPLRYARMLVRGRPGGSRSPRTPSDRTRVEMTQRGTGRGC